MAKQSITVELDDETLRSLAALGEPVEVLARLAHSAADGVLRPSHPQREQTDESLRVEREKSDAAILMKRKAVEVQADEVVRIARQRADLVVQTARDDVDGERERGPHSTARETRSERERADVLLKDERSNADTVLGDEREERRVEGDRTSVGVAEKREADEKEADEVVRIARQRADQLVLTAREDADRERRPISTASSERERTRADGLLEGERSNADALLEHERREQRRHTEALLTAERKATDKDLSGERTQADTVLVGQREANEQMVLATIRAQELAEVAEEARTRASLALEVTDEQFRRLVESVSDYAILMLDPNGIITTWNRGVERINGYKADEIIGQHFSRFYSEEDVRAGVCERELEIATRVGRSEDEGWRKRKDGSRFWANVVIAAIRDPKDGKLVGLSKVTRDLTAQKAADEEQIQLAQSRESERELRTVAEFREMFIGILGHDLRNPLASIVMSAASLLYRGHLEAQDAEAAARIIRSSQRITRMITQLLDLTRARLGGGLPIAPKPTDLREVCRDIVEEFEATIQLEVTGDVTGTWDQDRLAEVLSNLAGNAVQYSTPGTVVVVRAYADGADVVVEISNQGDPISAEVLPFIFEPFRRERRREKPETGNLGLGLYIAKQIVLSHGGTLDVHSADGATTFVVRVPRHPPGPFSE